ncbi:MAG: LLM class flavin-dependent oxidoreductase [Halobacteriaceae archaeon]
MALQLGHSVTSAFDGDATDAAEGVLARAGAARDAGFDYVQVGDHHVVDEGGYLANVPLAARLAGVFDRVAAMFLLPLYDPVELAERTGTLAALTDFEPWFALGWREHAYDVFGTPWGERAAVFEANLEAVRRLWREEPVALDDPYRPVADVRVAPGADPERVVVGGGARPAVERAGRLGDAWVAAPTETAADVECKRRWFDGAGGGDLVVRRDALVLEDGDDARARARTLLADGYRGWPADATWPLVGAPEEVAEDLAELVALGATDVVVRPMDRSLAAETFAGLSRARAAAEDDTG